MDINSAEVHPEVDYNIIDISFPRHNLLSIKSHSNMESSDPVKLTPGKKPAGRPRLDDNHPAVLSKVSRTAYASDYR